MNLVSAAQQLARAFPSARISVSCSANSDFDDVNIVFVLDIEESRYVDVFKTSNKEIRETQVAKMEVRLARKVNDIIADLSGVRNASTKSIN